MSKPYALISPWLSTSVLLAGALFLLFILVEYRQNIALIGDNQSLIAESARIRLQGRLLENQPQTNWAEPDAGFGWVMQAPDHYRFLDGLQVFPWARRVTPSSPAAKQQWSEVWSSIDTLSISQHINSQRLHLLIAVKEALHNNDTALIRQTFDNFMAHKKAYILSPVEEIAFSLKLVELGIEKHWNPTLVNAILLTGGSPQKPLIHPVADLLFRYNHLFSTQEVSQVVSTIKHFLEQVNLSHYFLDAYQTHLEDPQFTLPDLDTTEPTLINKDWLVTNLTSDKQNIVAYRIDLDRSLSEIEQQFNQLGVLQKGDSLHLNKLQGVQTVNNLVVDVDKQQLELNKHHQKGYLAIKTLMAIAFVFFILWMLHTIEKTQRRRLEYLGLKEDFVKLVSHELKTPLAGIRAMAETLRKRIQRNLDVQHYPERIVNETDKLWYMVDNILSFNRIRSKQITLNRKTTNLRKLCESIAEQLRSLSDKHYIIANEIPSDVEVEVDVELFSLIIKNVFVNAGLYNHNDTISIVLSFERYQRVLNIQDNGVGIKPDDQERVFQAFVRLPQSSRHSGTGLGLALCRKIIELHKGTLSIKHSDATGTLWQLKMANKNEI